MSIQDIARPDPFNLPPEKVNEYLLTIHKTLIEKGIADNTQLDNDYVMDWNAIAVLVDELRLDVKIDMKTFQLEITSIYTETKGQYQLAECMLADISQDLAYCVLDYVSDGYVKVLIEKESE